MVYRRLALTLLATALLGGCGFRPLYGSMGPAGSPDVVAALGGVVIHPIADRPGQKLRQVLTEKLHPRGSDGATSGFDLHVKLTSQVQELGVRQDSTTSRANMIFFASYTLAERGAPILNEAAQAVVSYNILDDQYATVASVADAEDRAIRQLGEEIKTRLAIYFDQRQRPAVAQSR